MNTSYTYDPEDIESLLMHKQFNELYPEEKEFVLRHVEGPEEYESLRQTLFLMHDAADQDEWLEPDPSIRKNLMAQFVREEKKGFFVWLNGLFAAPLLPEMPWYRKPAMRYAFAGVTVLAVVGATWLYTSRDGGQAQIASAEQTVLNTDSIQQSPTEMTNAGKRTYADNLKPDAFPPAPAPMDEVMKYPNVDYIPTEESAVEMVTEGNVTSTNFYSADVSEIPVDDDKDAPGIAEPVLEPTRNEEMVIVTDKVTTTTQKQSTEVVKAKHKFKKDSNAGDEDLALEKEVKKPQEEMDANAAPVVTQYAQPEVAYSPSFSATDMTTTSGSATTYTVIANDNNAVYNWDLTIVPTNSRNASDMKPVISVLFTAK